LEHLLFPKTKGKTTGKFLQIVHWKDVKIGDNEVDLALNTNLVSVSSVIYFCWNIFILLITGYLYYQQVVSELSMSNGELENDIVKEVLR